MTNERAHTDQGNRTAGRSRDGRGWGPRIASDASGGGCALLLGDGLLPLCMLGGVPNLPEVPIGPSAITLSRDGPSPRLAEIRLHPIKSLDAVTLPECRIGPGGGLELDRVWALYSTDGDCINGKRTAAIHRIRAAFAPDVSSVTLSATGDRRGNAPQTFAFPGDCASAGEWFSEYLGQRVTVRYAPEGVPDDTLRNGPIVVSTATLRTVSEWFPGIDLEELRRRFRTPLEIDGVDAFWEDRLFSVHETDAVRFTIGDVNLDGINPCPRCVVPARDSLSGIDTIAFQRRFSDLRRAHYPSWACEPDRIKHFYHLGINTRVAPSEHGKWLRVGDSVNCTKAVL